MPGSFRLQGEQLGHYRAEGLAGEATFVAGSVAAVETPDTALAGGQQRPVLRAAGADGRDDGQRLRGRLPVAAATASPGSTSLLGSSAWLTSCHRASRYCASHSALRGARTVSAAPRSPRTAPARARASALLDVVGGLPLGDTSRPSVCPGLQAWPGEAAVERVAGSGFAGCAPAGPAAQDTGWAMRSLVAPQKARSVGSPGIVKGQRGRLGKAAARNAAARRRRGRDASPPGRCCRRRRASRSCSRRQRSASAEAGVAECGEHVAQVFVVGCTEQQAVDVASGLVPLVHQATETQPGTGEGQDPAGAGAISRSADYWASAVWVQGPGRVRLGRRAAAPPARLRLLDRKDCCR